MLGKSIGVSALILLGCVVVFCALLFAFASGDKMQPQYSANPPSDLIHWLRDILDDNVAAWRVISRQYFWLLEDGLIIGVTDGRGQSVMLFTDGTNVFRTNCASGLPHINRILESLPFPESNLQDEGELRSLLSIVVDLFHGPGGIIATRRYLQGIESAPLALQPWLVGTKTDPNEFRAIWVDPQVTRAEKQWTITLTYLKRDGSVDKWLMSGGFDQTNEHVVIDSIQIATLKEKGFFHWAIVP